MVDVLASGADPARCTPKSVVKSGKSSAKWSAKSSVRSTMSCWLFGFRVVSDWTMVVSSGEAAVNRGEGSVLNPRLLWKGPAPAMTDRDVSTKLQH